SRPSNAPPQTTNNSHRAVVDGSNSVANGVYVPAITMKMFEWSKRRSTPATCGDQVPRWEMALVVNRISVATANTAVVAMPLLVGAVSVSTNPTTRATGAITAWIQPRSRGFA